MALVVITGGTRSGKSAAAERLAEIRELDGQSVAVAVFARCGDDAEMSERVARHQRKRPATFCTIEAADDLDGWLEGVADDTLLVVDCLGTLLGLLMERAWERTADSSFDDSSHSLPEGFEHALAEQFSPVLEALLARRADTIVVTNEVGMSVVSEWASARVFTDTLGRANRALVAAADAAYLCVAGRLIDLSDLASQARWPED
jgi:adenosylcobinamide kinase/adenosylcobinamide-phosphate guanylyltransferase